MRIKIEIKNTDNEAFSDSPELEVARILHKLADKIETTGEMPSCRLMDCNGNHVGDADTWGD